MRTNEGGIFTPLIFLEDYMDINLYHISTDYLNYLRAFDERIPYNKEGGRPFVGIVLRINDTMYFAPMHSSKPKYLTMRPHLDFFKLADGKLGIINLNNMIPVPPDQVTPIIFAEIENEKYRALLIRQYSIIERNKKMIQSNALKTYVYSQNSASPLHRRCLNFPMMEVAAEQYHAFLKKQSRKVIPVPEKRYEKESEWER